MLKTAGTKERMRDDGGIVTGACWPKTITHAVDVTQRRENIQRARQNTLAQKKLQHSLRAGANCAFPYRRLYCAARIQEKLGAIDAREHLLPVRIAAVTKRAGGEPKQ